MKFPKFVPSGLTPEQDKELIEVLEKSKEFLWVGTGSCFYHGDKYEFICHAIEHVYECDEGFYFNKTDFFDAQDFIQHNIDASMHSTYCTFCSWRETIYPRVRKYVENNAEEYKQYRIDVQSHRKAWIDYLINNLKGNENEIK